MSSVSWEVVTPGGPALCNHIGCFLNGRIFLHGGVTQKRSTAPSNSIYELHPEQNIWREIRSSDSPALSHHAYFTVSDRFLVLVGGWNGKERSSDVFVFDSKEEKWRKPTVKGFPEGGGLSSHVVLPLADNTALVIGREGGLRTQRRAGSAFLLRYKPDLSDFTYTEFPLGTHSRSCHTITTVAGYVFIIGGRDHSLIEVHSALKPQPLRPVVPSSLTSLCSNFEKYTTLMPKEPPCLKSHVAFACQNAVVVHGGETFDGRQKDAHSEMYLLNVEGRHGDWFRLTCANPIARESHVAIATPGCVYIHGGCTARGAMCCELLKLTL